MPVKLHGIGAGAILYCIYDIKKVLQKRQHPYNPNGNPPSSSLRGEAEAIRGFCWIASASPGNDGLGSRAFCLM